MFLNNHFGKNKPGQAELIYENKIPNGDLNPVQNVNIGNQVNP